MDVPVSVRIGTAVAPALAREESIMLTTAKVRAIVGLAALAFVAGLAPGEALAQMGTGKESAFLRDSYVGPVPSSSPGHVFDTVTIAKGKKKRNLVIDVMANYFNTVDGVQPEWRAKVNGIAVSPATWLQRRCPAGEICLDSTTWWVDLDDLEASNPDTIVGEPLAVTIEVTDASGPHPSSSGFIFQLAARLEKK
jgi:hypothetical protein